MSDKVTHVKFGVVFSVGMSILLSHLTVSDITMTVTYAIVGGLYISLGLKVREK